MKYGWLILGIVLLAVGTLFSLQGLGVAKGSAMTGQSFWLWVGVVCVVVGVAVIVNSLRTRAR